MAPSIANLEATAGDGLRLERRRVSWSFKGAWDSGADLRNTQPRPLSTSSTWCTFCLTVSASNPQGDGGTSWKWSRTGFFPWLYSAWLKYRAPMQHRCFSSACAPELDASLCRSWADMLRTPSKTERGAPRPRSPSRPQVSAGASEGAGAMGRGRGGVLVQWWGRGGECPAPARHTAGGPSPSPGAVQRYTLGRTARAGLPATPTPFCQPRFCHVVFSLSLSPSLSAMFLPEPALAERSIAYIRSSILPGFSVSRVL